MTPRGTERTNDEWLRELHAQASSGALDDLSAYLRGGLAKALAAKGGVDDDDLDDFTQDALVRVIEKLDTFRGESRLTTWAMAIAIRVAYTKLRRRRWNNVSLEDLELGKATAQPAVRSPDALNPEEIAARLDLLTALRLAIDTVLTERQRTVVMAELHGMPTAELAAQLDTNPNALYKVYHDARKKLRRALEEKGFSAEEVRTTLEGASNR